MAQNWESIFNGNTFVAPGYAVANTLDDILTQKRLEARQKMLDSLNQRNIESEIADRDENARGLKETREAQAEQRGNAAWNEWMKGAGYQMGQDVTDIDPTHLQEGIKRGVFSQQAPTGMTPSVTTSESMGPTAPANVANVAANAPQPAATAAGPAGHYYYTGDAAAREADRRKTMIGQLIAQSGDSSPELRTILTAASIYPDKDFTPDIVRVLTSKTQQGQHHVEYDASGAHIVSEGDFPAGTSFGRGANPPQGAQGNDKLVDVIGDDGKHHWMSYNPKKSAWEDVKPPAAGGNFTPPPKGNQNPALPYDQHEADKYVASIKAGNPQQMQAAAQTFINTVKARDPILGQDVATIIGNPQLRTMSVPDLVKNGILTAPPNVDPNTFYGSVESILKVLVPGK